ncbi:RHS repeat domain-containing protein, partial [Treponema pedis]|uniref:RHS repeat domain-containing protein n=1 Tax=Treponema pedis TaxID=409322 RepID=UPI00056F5745
YNNFLAKQPEGLIEEATPGMDKLPFRFTGKELDEDTGLYYYGARYLDPKYSRWLSGGPALNEYIPQAPVNDEAKKHNENLPGIGCVFNVVNLHVYHYAGNNPIKYADPDGEKTFDSRWWVRNWDNLLSLGCNVFEIVAGAFMGGLMIIHGGANSILAADMYGDDYSDNLDSIMPDTALGFIGYRLGLMAETVIGLDAYDWGQFAEKIGALCDFLDVSGRIAISGNEGKNLNNAIAGFMKSSGKYISKADLFKLQKYLQQANANSALKIINGILENYDRLTSSQSNVEQLVSNISMYDLLFSIIFLF